MPKDIVLTNLTTIYLEGSLLPAKYHQALQKLLPDVDIFHWYGQTEVGGLTTFRKIDLHRMFNNTKPGCVGTPIEGFGIFFKVSFVHCVICIKKELLICDLSINFALGITFFTLRWST